MSNQLADLHGVDPREFFNKRCLLLREPETKQYIDFYQQERRNRYGYVGLLPAEYVHEYHKIKNEWQRKIALIDVDGDLVIAVLKHVQMFQHIYKRLEGLPISMSGNREAEAKVFHAMRNFICKKFLVCEPESVWVEEQGLVLDTEHKTYNYYSHVPTHLARIGMPKWLTKKGVTRLLNDKKLTARKLVEPSSSIEAINEAFMQWKRDVENTKWLSLHFAEAIAKYRYWEDPNIEYYLFEYDGTPVGLVVYLIVNNDIGYQLVNKGVSHMVGVDAPAEVTKRLGAYMHYLTMQDLYTRGVVDVFAGGAMGIRKASLGVHKAIMTDHSFGVRIYE